MSRLFFGFVLAAVASIGNAIAQGPAPQGNNTARPPSDIETNIRAIYENACAMAATGILTGAPIGNIPDEIALCNKHPNKQTCLDTKQFIELRGKAAPGLTCE